MDLGKAQIGQGDRLAGRREKPALHGPVHRPYSHGIARHEHPPQRIQKDDAIPPVKGCADFFHDLCQTWSLVAAQAAGQGVHDDFGVRIEREMVPLSVQQLPAQGRVVGHGTIERETEPLPQPAVMPFKGLGIAGVVGPGSGVPRVADSGTAGVFPEDRLVLFGLGQAKNLADGPDILEGVEKLGAFGVIGSKASGQLSPCLHVQEHAGYQRGDILSDFFPAIEGFLIDRLVEPVERRHAAFVIEVFTHSSNPVGCEFFVPCMESP